MIMVILHYPAVAPTLGEVRADKEKSVPFFENEIPGLIDKTWGMNEETGRMASVYHFEDRPTADAWFDSEKQRSFRRQNKRHHRVFRRGGPGVSESRCARRRPHDLTRPPGSRRFGCRSRENRHSRRACDEEVRQWQANSEKR